MFHQRSRHKIYSAKTLERPKKGCRVFQFPSQLQSYGRNGKMLKPARRKWKNTRNFTKKKNNDMKRNCKDIKKIMQMKWRSLNFRKSETRRMGRFYSLNHYPNQMNLKNDQNPLMVQARKNRSLKKHQAMGKRRLQRQEVMLKILHILKKYQSP